MKQIALIFIIFNCLPLITFAQQNGPGDPGGDPSSGGGSLGGGAPIGSGLFILIGLGTTYAGRKTFKLYQENKKVLEE